MSDPFLDRLAGPERTRILKRLRSPEAYERLREKVKGPEDLERELDRAEKVAELHFALESNQHEHDRLKEFVEKTMHEEGIDALVDEPNTLPEEIRNVLKEGRFRLAVNDDALMLLPEGTVQEKIPVRSTLMDACLSQLSTDA